MFQALIKNEKVENHDQSRGQHLDVFLPWFDYAIVIGQLLNIERPCAIGMFDAGTGTQSLTDHFNMRRGTIVRL